MIKSSRPSNDQFHNCVNRTHIFYQTHSIKNEIRERKNLTLIYKFKRTTFANEIFYMTSSSKL